jgi:hypothetical protein
MHGRHGAVDPPGTTWHDRPGIERGNRVFLAGDMVAAPGLLSEVAFTSAIEAGRSAVLWATSRRRASLSTTRDRAPDHAIPPRRKKDDCETAQRVDPGDA